MFAAAALMTTTRHTIVMQAYIRVRVLDPCGVDGDCAAHLGKKQASIRVYTCACRCQRGLKTTHSRSFVCSEDKVDGCTNIAYVLLCRHYLITTCHL
jgi:hypothetical protein